MAKRNLGSTTQRLKPTNNILCIACPGTLPRIYHTEAEAAHAAELLRWNLFAVVTWMVGIWLFPHLDALRHGHGRTQWAQQQNCARGFKSLDPIESLEFYP